MQPHGRILPVLDLWPCSPFSHHQSCPPPPWFSLTTLSLTLFLFFPFILPHSFYSSSDFLPFTHSSSHSFTSTCSLINAALITSFFSITIILYDVLFIIHNIGLDHDTVIFPKSSCIIVQSVLQSCYNTRYIMDLFCQHGRVIRIQK